MDRFNVHKINHRNPVVVPGYKFEKDISLFSAIVLADLKHNGDKQSLFKVNNLLRSPGALLRFVSKTFRPIIGNDVHLSNDLDAVQPWCELYKKNVLIYTFDKDSRTLKKEFDSSTRFEDTLELLKTTEYRDDYHFLIDKQRFLTAIENATKTVIPVQKRSIVRMNEKRKLCEEFDNFVKAGFSKVSRLDNDVEMKFNPVPVVEDVHFKPDKTWLQLSQIQKNHLHECEKCAYPYYNALPEEECLLTIRSHLMEKDMKVSPYQHLFVTAENYQLGDIKKNSHLNLYYLNHVKKIKKDLTAHCKIN